MSKILKTKNLIVTGVIFGIIGLGWLFMSSLPKQAKFSPAIENLAQCLTEKKVVMYGAYWCPHCQNQKKLFGDSFSKVAYVECTEEVQKCQDNKIEGYPTWVFSDGSRIEGEATLEQLAQKSSCTYP